ncbi:stalk domain-containing protein [[Clostridium] colinum]|uniref:stalk domain-containing protein n=1 Tax=[Clostridium] colinum TaxID=36835 RepID=UPI002025A525|nr:stalk domain-containing protein [[Clostridium] colinum]
MKNKIILNILIIYFLILSSVLLIQLSSKKTNAIEPLPNELTAEDKLKNSVVLAINSPVIIINEKQFLIDENDSTLVPIIEDGKVYIPAKFLQTAFGANISFSKQTKETIIRLYNKAIIFSNNGTSIQIIDNTSQETIKIDTKAKIINDRFYIPLRSFADIFDKEVFYNDDLIIISNMVNLFDPIEELNILKELEKQVKQLPIVGNNENLRHLSNKYALDTQNNLETPQENLLNINDLPNLLKDNNPIIIKKTNNYNIYVNQAFIEVYFVTKDKEEIFSFKVEKINNNIKDIKITDNRFIITYMDSNLKTVIYDISDRKNIQTVKVIENNGDFYKNIIDGNNLYTISKININKYKNKEPYFEECIYNNNVVVDIKTQNFNLNKIFYFPDINDNNYTLISYINLYDMYKPLSNSVYLGMGNDVIINEDNIYVTTHKNQNNNLYQFKATLNGIEYVERRFIKGNFKSLEMDEEKQFLKFILDNNIIYLDNNLNIR